MPTWGMTKPTLQQWPLFNIIRLSQIITKILLPLNYLHSCILLNKWLLIVKNIFALSSGVRSFAMKFLSTEIMRNKWKTNQLHCRRLKQRSARFKEFLFPICLDLSPRDVFSFKVSIFDDARRQPGWPIIQRHKPLKRNNFIRFLNKQHSKMSMVFQEIFINPFYLLGRLDCAFILS